MTTENGTDPYSPYRFRLEIEGIPVGGFSECTALSSHTTMVEFREEGDHPFSRQIPAGAHNYSGITLKRGITQDPEFWKQVKRSTGEAPKLMNGSILLMNDAGICMKRWAFMNAWIKMITGPATNDRCSKGAIETLELICEGLE